MGEPLPVAPSPSAALPLTVLPGPQAMPGGDTAWALKRDWADTEFQGGSAGNAATLRGFEEILFESLRQACSRESAGAGAVPEALSLASQAASSSLSSEGVLARGLAPLLAASGDCGPSERVRAAVLSDPEVLGSSLDISCAYLKNYEVDKAAAVMETVLPFCRARGGLWLLKALNNIATVRMKQARPKEALAALEESEAVAAARMRPEDMDQAWEFWETTYRNFGWVYNSLDREAEAMRYIQKAIDCKERVGKSASWFDYWDLGRIQAHASFKRNEVKEIQDSQAVVTKALWLHRDTEKSDLVMRAKIWHSVGECSFALGHLAEAASGSRFLDENPNAPATSCGAKAHYRKALKCFKEAHTLFAKTEGKYNPLTGGEAQAVSWSLLKLDLVQESKPYLLDALESTSRQQSGWGEGSTDSEVAPALDAASQTTGRILEAHRSTDDREGLSKYFPAIERLCANIAARIPLSKDREDAGIYERFVSSCSMIMAASGTDDGAERSQKLLRSYMWERPSTMQAKICDEILQARSLGPGGALQLPESHANMALLGQLMAGGTTQKGAA